MTRERLPNRRGHEVISFVHDGILHVAGIGRFADGRLAEVFLDAARTGTPVEAYAHDLAVTASIALQQGATPETLAAALARDEDGRARGAPGALLDILAVEAAAGEG